MFKSWIAWARSARFVGVVLVCLTVQSTGSAEDLTSALHGFLQDRVEAERIKVGIVVGIVDEQGSRVVSCGKTDIDKNPVVDGDTLFEIGSTTKTFTGLLLQEMIERGEMRLDDPVAKFLPNSVKIPSRNGKEITLGQLATHTSGLPRDPDNFHPRRAENPCADYTIEDLYAFLAGYPLPRDPGERFEYSNPGMALLGQAIARTAGTSYEALVVKRICKPLQMDSTRITLTPELRARFAIGHSRPGCVMPASDFGAMNPVGGLRSTANDMLKYLAANLGLTPSSLTPIMEKTHATRFFDVMPDTDIGLAWVTSRDPQGRRIVWHNGATYGYVSFIGFDKVSRRGVVVLSNSRGTRGILDLGSFLLHAEWQSKRRPTKAALRSEHYDSYLGRYQPLPSFAAMQFQKRQFLLEAPAAVLCGLTALFLAPLTILFYRAGSLRRRGIILGIGALMSGALAGTYVLMSRAVSGESSQPGIAIRREGDRLFAQVTGTRSWPVDVLLSPIAAELLPESEGAFFERLSGAPMTFSRDARGKVTGLTMEYRGEQFCYAKVSDEPAEGPESPTRPVPVELDERMLDSFVGHYQFVPHPVLCPSGMKMKIWREGSHLMGQVWAKEAIPGPFEICPESETTLFLKIDGAELIFAKNPKGQATAVTYHQAGEPDLKGERVPDAAD